MIPSLLPTYSRAPMNFVRGEGSWLIEADGRRFLDFGSGIATASLGHANPKLVAALTEQANALWHISNLYSIPQQTALADKLVEASFADTVFFTNSGTESCELAVKMVRKYWHTLGQDRPRVLTFEGCFHGRSSAAIAAAGTPKMVEGFGPLLPGFTQLPWDDFEAVKAAVAEPDVGAICVEPVQGEGGIRTMPDAQLKELRALCDETGVLLVLDEVQCGMGRTGRLFAHEWAGITPDIAMAAKGIGGGFPLGAVLATEEAAKGMTLGTHGSTYGGNPLGCAVGLAVVNELLSEGFLDGVNRKAGHMRQAMEGLVAEHPEVFSEVRGAGLLTGLVCVPPVGEVITAGWDAEVIVIPAADNVARLIPALTITEDEISEGIARLGKAAAALKAG